jgi:Uma2 family endonuclease
MSSVPLRKFTPEEYLMVERQARYRSEFVNGEIFAMAGASLAHNRIVFNLAGELRAHLRGTPCQGAVNDLRVSPDRTRLYTYPDVVIYCEPVEYLDDHRDTITNPSAIIEVLSLATRGFDMGAKFTYYRKAESLRFYATVEQEEAKIVYYERQPDGAFLMREAAGLDATIRIEFLNLELHLADLYEGVEFPPPTSAAIA